jgi:hypothetical protein
MGSRNISRSGKGGSAFCGWSRLFPAIFLATALLGCAQGLRAQISPSEILNPRVKALEKDYFSQLIAYNRAIQALQFPFPFQLRRYVSLPPKANPAPDTRGLQFLKFHNQIILKISGDYKAAFNGRTLTRNQRAARVFEDVVAPILRILPQQIPAAVPCDGVGLEISYHVRSHTHSYDFEGVEDMVVILRKKDAFDFSRLSGKDQWQIVLNRSWVYIDQKEYGLALSGRDPFPLEALDRSAPDSSEPSPGGTPGPAPETANSAPAPAATAPAGSGGKLTNLYRNLSLGTQLPGESQSNAAPSSPPVAKAGPPAAQAAPQADTPPAATKEEAEKLQARYQTQLDTLAKDGAARLHFVEYAPPSFVIFQNRLYLQITVRNPQTFDPQAGSIYKRAAQSFDLFLALQLKFLLAQVPSDPDLAGLDITVLNDLASKPKPSSEAAEFICPLAPLRKFVDAEITNQDLINQSIVLVNGVRIALNLQQVE